MSTKKMLRTIIIMAVLVVLAIVSYLLVDASKQKEENAELEEANSLRLFSFNSDYVNAVTIDTAEGNFQIENVSGVWTLKDTNYAHPFTLNTYYINTVCSYMSSLTALEKLSTDADRPEIYGLAEPVTVTCYEGSTGHTIYIGNPSATQEYYYAMLPDDDTVYGISYTEGDALGGGIRYLRSPYMIDYNDVDITEVTLAHGKETTYDIALQDGLWYMYAPLPNANVNSAQVKSMITMLSRMEVDTFIGVAEQKSDLTAYGLDKPEYTMTIAAGDKKTVLQFAKANENTVYLLNEENGLISTMSLASAGFLDTQPVELLNDTLLSISFEETAELDVLIDYDMVFTMTMDHENGQYLLNDTDISGLGDNALATYKNLFDTMAKLSYENMELEADIPEDAQSACEFTFTLTDGTQTVLTLIESDEENLYWALLNDEYTGFTVRRRALTSNTGVLSFYERMTDIIAEN